MIWIGVDPGGSGCVLIACLISFVSHSLPTRAAIAAVCGSMMSPSAVGVITFTGAKLSAVA